MRKWVFTLAASLVLASCGDGSGVDFVIDVAESPNNTQAELGALNHGYLAAAFHLKPAYKVESEPGTVSYVIPAGGDHESGKLHMAFTDNGRGGSRVAVTLDLPDIVSGQMILSERKAERALKMDMGKWAKAKSNGKSATYEKQQIASTVAALTVALQKWDVINNAGADAMLAGADMSAMYEIEGDEYDRDSAYEESEGYGAASDDFQDNASAPMDSLDGGGDDYSAPMDDGQGLSGGGY